MRDLIMKVEADHQIYEESIFIPLNKTDKLHLKRFFGKEVGIPVFLLHGSVENGRIFYSASGKGLAPFLARNGYDVFVADLRGKGLSTPSISRNSKFGLTECITEEIPALLNEIRKIKGRYPEHWIAHSWGGVLLLCYAARFPAQLSISSMVFFGTKRRITIKGLQKFITVDVLYNYLFPIIARLKGYVDVKMLNAGADNETEKSRRQTYRWVTDAAWLDDCGFNYSSALKSLKLPPIMFIAGKKDKVLGHYEDVKLLMSEIAQPNDRLYYASRQNGNLHDYDHVNMLTHHDAPQDHFRDVLKWMKDHHRISFNA